MIKTGLAIIGACTVLVAGIFVATALWPCDGDCRAYWDWLGGGRDPGCWQCKRKERTEK